MARPQCPLSPPWTTLWPGSVSGVRMSPDWSGVRITPEMTELLDLAGLGVEVQRQAERGKEPLGIEGMEEEGELGDPPA